LIDIRSGSVGRFVYFNRTLLEWILFGLSWVACELRWPGEMRVQVIGGVVSP